MPAPSRHEGRISGWADDDGYLLADQLQITKQSVNDLLRHLEQHGYITRQHDPTDGRARIVRLTAKGRRLDTTVGYEARSAEL